MKKTLLIVFFLLPALVFAEKRKPLLPASRLQGVWCAGEEGMILQFLANDTLFITSASDESVRGKGKYSLSDSTFAATIRNGETTLAVKYLYRWKGADTVEAKATLFTVNGEAVEHPQEWMSMVRCGDKAKK